MAAQPRLKSLSWLWRAAALTATYFLVANFGLRYATIGPSISPVWPPSGLAIGALVILGVRFWPAVLAGAFLANATTGVPILAALGIGIGNTVEAAIAAHLLRRGGTSVAFDDLGSVRVLVGSAAPLGALASATVGITTLWAAQVIPGSGLLVSGGQATTSVPWLSHRCW